jgi:hypothetical protein
MHVVYIFSGSSQVLAIARPEIRLVGLVATNTFFSDVVDHVVYSPIAVRCVSH